MIQSSPGRWGEFRYLFKLENNRSVSVRAAGNKHILSATSHPVNEYTPQDTKSHRAAPYMRKAGKGHSWGCLSFCGKERLKCNQVVSLW